MHTFRMVLFFKKDLPLENKLSLLGILQNCLKPLGENSKVKNTKKNKIFIQNFCEHLWHGCAAPWNLQMGPKYLTKIDVQLNPDILRTRKDKGYCKRHQNKKCLAIANVYHFVRVLIKNLYL